MSSFTRLLRSRSTSKAAALNNGLSISGDLNSIVGQSYALDFFASSVADPSGYGEADVFLGSTVVAIPPGADCTAHFVAGLDAIVPVGWKISATATDPSGNTSELGLAIDVEPFPPLDIVPAPPSSVLLSWTNTATGYGVLMTESLTLPINWLAVTNEPASSNGRWEVMLPIQNAPVRFYRLGLQ